MLPLNISANIGTVSGAVWQANGTDRIKGSCENLVEHYNEVKDFFEAIVKPELVSHSDTTSRLSLRFFCTQAGKQAIKNELPSQWESFLIRIEAAIPIGTLWWVWIGGNHPKRVTSHALLTELEERFNSSVPEWNFNDAGLYSFEEFHDPDSVDVNRIAELYGKRFKRYVAPNQQTDYIRNDILASPQNQVFVARSLHTSRIDAVIINEFADYPVQSSTRRISFSICESNDWVKESSMPPREFCRFLKYTLSEAQKREVDLIETECLPSAFTTAKRVGFRPVGRALLRQSSIETDIPNPEHTDPLCPETFRGFNSLFLFTLPTV